MKNVMVAAAAVALAATTAFAQSGNTGYDQSQQPNQQSEQQGQTGTPSDTSNTSASGMGMTGSMSDANLAAMLKAIDQHEVREGKMAEKKAKSSSVKKFARMMVRDHGQNEKQIAQVSKRIGLQPAENSDITAMKDQAKSDVQALEGQSGQDFDRTYIDQMVKGHQQALQKIDQAISNNAGRSSELSSLLTKTRQTVANHLQEAQRIQSELGGSQGTQGTESTPNSQGY